MASILGNTLSSSSDGGSREVSTAQLDKIAIGINAGLENQGTDAIAIGKNAGVNDQASNSIILNATGEVLNNDATNDTNSFFVKPIKNKTNIARNVLLYDTSTGEISTETGILRMNTSTGSSIIYSELINDLGGVPNIDINRICPTVNARVIKFAYNGSFCGVITVSTNSTNYATTSDYRLKNIIGDIENPSIRLLALKPIRFSWKSNGEIVDGFLAHEAKEVVPEAVSGEKDAVDADGNPEYQGIDQSKLVPLLVAALQDALKRIEVLENPV